MNSIDGMINPDVIKESTISELKVISNSDRITFMNGVCHILFHFESELTFQEMTSFVESMMIDNKNLDRLLYFLLPYHNQISSNSVEEQMLFFLDINDQKPINSFFINTDSLDDEEIHKLLMEDLMNMPRLYDLKKEVCKLSIDEILDKIYEKGIDSLSDVEMSKLNDYAEQLK